eukprot:gnl/TRDRNA2_/TRDRNA2_138924_c1_seq1.p1 gnl/TRDRNA2_/TRDRNA2_138924_c1~~gnl/TRDRNA2_/TRDRNA2_138924_c1_seq1.p1  ORF type:complete len:286 (-),score=43.45 gnl/TRDRNA2_/TRDRNA2_138924_c1_seq1:56-913(-)
MATTVSHRVKLPDGAEIDCKLITTGSKPPRATLLFFNGAFCNLSLWDHVSPELVQAGLRVVTHDVRGAGASLASPQNVKGSEQFTFEQYAEDAAHVLDSLRIQEVIVCGAAWGSRPALVFATTQAQYCAGCVLMDFSVGNSVTKEWSMAQKMGLKLARRKLAELGTDEPKDPPPGFQTHANKKLAQMAMHATSKPPFNEPDSFTASSLRRLFPFPVSIITGEFDPNLVGPGGSDESLVELRTAGNTTAELRVVPSAGHAIVTHRPKLLAAELIRFTKAVRRPSSL